MNDKLKNLTLRTLSGLGIIVVVVGAILWSRWSLGLLLTAILLFGMHETFRLAELGGLRPQRVLGLLSGLLLLGSGFAASRCDSIADMHDAGYLFCAFLLSVPMLFICEVLRGEEKPLANLGATLLAVGYVAMPLALLCLMGGLGDVYAPWTLLGFIFIIWANDVFAYLTGMTLGRHRLCERLSPKKSWEGFIGGVIGAGLTGWLMAWLLQESTGHWIGLALIAAVTGVLGDLAESMFKRAAGVKDSGALIPGHGGMLDRFDALLLATPFAAVYMIFTHMI